MNATLYGQIENPSVAVIGVWDPMLPLHRDLFAELSEYARSTGKTSLAILLDPDPRALMYGVAHWPVYDDVKTRQHLLQAAGIDAILQLEFQPADIETGAAEVLALVTQHVPIVELWLGANQRLGSGDRGSAPTVQRVADQHAIQLRRLPEVAHLPQASEVRKLLATGRIADAAAIVGRYPQRRRPAAANLQLAWSPGLYEVDVSRLDLGRDRFTLELTKDPSDLATTDWPNPLVTSMTFLAGPRDVSVADAIPVALAG